MTDQELRETMNKGFDKILAEYYRNIATPSLEKEQQP